jgi:hypothetical protein
MATVFERGGKKGKGYYYGAKGIAQAFADCELGRCCASRWAGMRKCPHLESNQEPID